MQRLEIAAQLELLAAPALADTLRDRVADMHAGQDCVVDLDAWPATQPALQLLIATERALRARGVAVSPGQNAQMALNAVMHETDQPS